MEKLYIILSLVFMGIFLLFWIKRNGNKEFEKLQVESEKYSIENILDIVKNEFNSMTRSSLDSMGLNDIMYSREVKKRAQLMLSLKKCIYGSINDKEYIKDMIYDILDKRYIDEKNIDFIINFKNPVILSNREKFDIILHHYKKQYGREAFTKLIEKYNLDKLKIIEEDRKGYVITEDEIKEIYLMNQSF